MATDITNYRDIFLNDRPMMDTRAPCNSWSFVPLAVGTKRDFVLTTKNIGR